MPTYVKTFVCLANSRKLLGRCVAGKEWEKGRGGAWIRPVGASGTGEVSEEDRRYSDGTDPVLGDVIGVQLASPAPKAYQTENHVIDSSHYWLRVGRIGWADIASLADHPASLWANVDSSYAGVNDRMPEAQAAELGHSLYLIGPVALDIVVGAPGTPFGNPKRTVRGSFTYAGAQYNLSITDPVIEREYLSQANGTYRVTHAYLCISLGEPYNGNVYKLIAAVITAARMA